MAIDILDGMPPAAEPTDPVGARSATLASVLPNLWQGDGGAIQEALAAVFMRAAVVPVEAQPDVLLQLLGGLSVEEIHPTTQLVVDAVLDGFAVKVPA